MHPEVERIINLPQMDHFGYSGEQFLHLMQPGGDQELLPNQAAALLAIKWCKGAFLPLGVGEGKTLISLLAPAVVDADRPLLLVPAKMVDVTVNERIPKYRKDWKVPDLTVTSYHSLSVKSGVRKLHELSPDLVIADECHKLSYRTATRTKRFLKYMLESGAMFVAMSGTATNRSLKDFAHLLELALGDICPVPRTISPWLSKQQKQQHKRYLQNWCDAIDADGTGQEAALVGAIHLKRRFAPEVEGQEGIRVGFQRRLASCPGVVRSSKHSVDASLRITLLNAPEPPEVCTLAVKEITASGERPDGEVLQTSLEVWNVLRQVAAGYYYKFDWGEAGPNLDWLDARRRWRSEVRDELAVRATEGYDSPLLVEEGVKAGGGSRPLRLAWEEWCKLSHIPEPPRATVVLDTYLADLAASISGTGAEVLIWYRSDAMEEMLDSADVFTFGRGTPEPDDPSRTRAPCLKIGVHGEGRDKLSQWSQNLFLEMPSSASQWEQVLGRTHRQGQEADEVEVTCVANFPFLVDSFDRAKEVAEYKEQTLGNPQKLLYADIIRA